MKVDMDEWMDGCTSMYTNGMASNMLLHDEREGKRERDHFPFKLCIQLDTYVYVYVSHCHESIVRRKK